MNAEPGGVDPDVFRRLLSRWVTGVSIVTAREDAQDYGLTVNALISVSLKPPTLLISLGKEANSTPVVSRTRCFAVNLLAADQTSLADRFAQPTSSEAKFAGLALHRGRTGAALIDGVLGALECRVEAEHVAGDHLLFVGVVLAQEAGRDGAPLIFYHGTYADASDPGSVRLPPPRTLR